MKVVLRPNWLPIFPKTTAPRGLNKKPTAKAAKEVGNDAIGSAEGRRIGNHACQKRIRIEIVLLEEGAASCDCWMSGMVLATASTSAYIAAKVSAQYTSPLAVDVANGEIDYMRVLRGLRGRSVAWA